MVAELKISLDCKSNILDLSSKHYTTLSSIDIEKDEPSLISHHEFFNKNYMRLGIDCIFVFYANLKSNLRSPPANLYRSRGWQYKEGSPPLLQMHVKVKFLQIAWFAAR